MNFVHICKLLIHKCLSRACINPLLALRARAFFLSISCFEYALCPSNTHRAPAYAGVHEVRTRFAVPNGARNSAGSVQPAAGTAHGALDCALRVASAART